MVNLMEATKMSIGTELTKYIGDRPHKVVALAWGEAWARSRAGEEYSHQHLCSSLSRLLNDKPEGVRFFFREAVRAKLLFDELEVPQKERKRLEHLARDAAVPVEEQPPRLVMDITPWGEAGDLDAMFRAVEGVLLRPDGLFPAVLVITEEQYRRLPRTFDDWEGRVRIARVDDDKAAGLVRDAAGDEALVLSPRRFEDFARWVAISLGDSGVDMDPPGAVDRFIAGGQFGGLPEVVHPLMTGELDSQAAELPSNPIELRKLMVALSTEDGARALGMAAGQRAGLGEALAIPVASTPSERVAAHLQKVASKLVAAGLPEPETCSDDDLRGILTRAQTRPTGPLTRRVDDVIHIVNAPARSLRGLGGDDAVAVHEVVARANALEQIIAELSTWVEEDVLRDPFLTDLVREEHEGLERLLKQHARTALLRSPRPLVSVQEAPPVTDILETIEKSFVGTLPPITARLVQPPPNDHVGHRLDVTRPDLVVDQVDVDEKWLVGRPPATRDVLLAPTEELVEFGFSTWRSEEEKANRYQHHQQTTAATPYRFPPQQWTIEDVETWLTVVENSPALAITALEDFERTSLFISARRPVQMWTRSPSIVTGWEELRRQGAQLFLALRRALRKGDVAVIGAGEAMVDIDNGLSAWIRARLWPRGATCSRTLRLRVAVSTDGGARALVPQTASLPTGISVRGYEEHRCVPRGFELVGCGVVMEVTLIPNALTARGASRSGVVGVLADDDD